jgi:hypothetical protein
MTERMVDRWLFHFRQNSWPPAMLPPLTIRWSCHQRRKFLNSNEILRKSDLGKVGMMTNQVFGIRNNQILKNTNKIYESRPIRSWNEGRSDLEIKLCEQALAYMTDHVLEGRATSAGICEQSMGARNRVGIGLSDRPARLHSLAELVPWNRFLGSLRFGF